MKQKISNIRVSLPMVFLLARLVNGLSLTALLIGAQQVFGFLFRVPNLRMLRKPQ